MKVITASDLVIGQQFRILGRRVVFEHVSLFEGDIHGQPSRVTLSKRADGLNCRILSIPVDSDLPLVPVAED
ncbi:MAG TPA: hypothetical protein VHA56_16220 [Mucilaginibacter sp.]|nr:hypothetical protein [Mucilaginibacter sp.]